MKLELNMFFINVSKLNLKAAFFSYLIADNDT